LIIPNHDRLPNQRGFTLARASKKVFFGHAGVPVQRMGPAQKPFNRMKIYAGIDGGGTRTRMALVEETGRLLGYATADSCSFADHGLEAARVGLAGLQRATWSAAGLAPRPAHALFMGMGSILSPHDARTNCDLAGSLSLAEPANIQADNDGWIAHAGGLAGRPGVLLISGTGSVCVGRNAAGDGWRAGGWGHLLNEAGSAYALGLDAMVAATREADGRGPKTSLTPLVCEMLQLPEIMEI
jgi:N-acetylglucosamine kinase-like BadF-type ATPase